MPLKIIASTVRFHELQ